MSVLLVNENFPRPALQRLRESGVDVEAVEELMPGASDVDVMSYANARNLWLVTFDRDYGELVFSRGMACPPAIIYLRQEPSPPERAAEILLMLLEQPEQIEGMFVIVSSATTRKRKLPTPLK